MLHCAEVCLHSLHLLKPTWYLQGEARAIADNRAPNAIDNQP